MKEKMYVLVSKNCKAGQLLKDAKVLGYQRNEDVYPNEDGEYCSYDEAEFVGSNLLRGNQLISCEEAQERDDEGNSFIVSNVLDKDFIKTAIEKNDIFCEVTIAEVVTEYGEYVLRPLYIDQDIIEWFAMQHYIKLKDIKDIDALDVAQMRYDKYPSVYKKLINKNEFGRYPHCFIAQGLDDNNEPFTEYFGYDFKQIDLNTIDINDFIKTSE